MMGRGLGIPALLPWWAGLAAALLGAAIIYAGHRQRARAFDPNRISLLSPTTCYFFGVILLLFGLIQLVPLLRD